MGAIRRATGQHYINDNGEPQLPAATTRISDFNFAFTLDPSPGECQRHE
jgi:hypothetical protein